MPELPEVETIRRQLAESVSGARMTQITVRRASCYAGAPFTGSEVITGVERVGKYLYIYFESGRGLAVHLKMTGRLVVDVPSYAELPHTRVIMELADGRRLYYWDSRTFGYVKYVGNVSEEHQKQKAKLGPDPWEITESRFYALTQKYVRPIKNLILDQAIIAGVGNIYANDGLWEAGVDPRRAAKSLTKTEAKAVLRGVRKVMERGLLTGGASDNSYVNALGKKGKYQDEFRVYKRTGEQCGRCGRILKRVVVGGRGSWLCEECQK